MQTALNPVHRVSIPLKDAYDISKIEGRLKDILCAGSCCACCSGMDIYLELERDFLVSPAFKTASTVATLAARSTPSIANTLIFAKDSGSKVDNVIQALRDFAAFSGHASCASGCDIAFMELQSSMKLDAVKI
jgi:hypothetical protein